MEFTMNEDIPRQITRSRLFARWAVFGLLAMAAFAMPPQVGAAEAQVICVDPLVKVLHAETNLPVTDAVADVAVGEYATLQFVFRAPVAVSNLSASTIGNVSHAAVRFVGFVKVGKPYDGPADTLHAPDGLFPDPLLEVGSVAVAANQNQPVWITVPARKPGRFEGELVVRFDGNELRRPFAVCVHDVRMKKPRLWVSNWWFSDPERLAMLAGHKVKPFSSEYWKLIRVIGDFMEQYHQNVVLISPLDLAQISRGHDGKWNFDFSRFDKTVKTFIAAGVIGRIEGAHVGGRPGEDWHAAFTLRVPEFGTNGEIHFVNLPPTNALAREFYGPFFTALARHLAARGWDKIYWQHIGDEPVDTSVPSYIQSAALLHEFAPGIPTIEATQTRKLVGFVNNWVPILDHFHQGADFFRERQQAGDEVWFYTCCGPTGNYANRFIEQLLIKPRLLQWINFRYGATGYLHWGFNYWNPTTSPFDETTFRWPAGDQWIVYPKNGKLLSSIRLETMRDGISDNELLCELAERDPATAQKLAAETILDFDRYDTDIHHFRDRRLQLLEALAPTTNSSIR
jgi:hypothetical protein